jgi:transcriptional antiterminator NusG
MTHNEKEQTAEQAGANRKWYSLRVISGKEKKIKERIDFEVERSNWKLFIFQVIVPTEKVYKIRNGKKVVQERNLLPGYILVEATENKLNGDVAKMISDIPNVIHFLGKETPLPMTQAEANRLLGKVDESAEAGETMVEPFLVGETVKIIDGPFTDFVGDIQEVNEEKKKLKVIVKIFGRGTEVELNFMQVEKIS